MRVTLSPTRVVWYQGVLSRLPIIISHKKRVEHLYLVQVMIISVFDHFPSP